MALRFKARFRERGFEMTVLIAIAGWTLGSILLGLALGHVFGTLKKRRRAEERFIVSLQTRDRKANQHGPNAPEAPKKAFAHQDTQKN